MTPSRRLGLAWLFVAALSSPLHAELPALDEGLASFGAAVSGDALYVYGGHVGGVHKHSKANLSHRFQRLDLKNPTAWQDIGDEVRGLQGLALVATDDGRVCRFGGLDALNETLEQEENLVSIDEVSCFDPEMGNWTALPPLPSPRSSHDAAVMGDQIFVAGGWQLRGSGQEAHWHDEMLVLDLAASEPTWRSVKQPFQRRALTVAVAGGKVFVCGGLGPDGTSLEVDIYDPASDSWSEGPELQIADGPMRGFGVSAFGVGDQVLLSGGDGVIFSLRSGDTKWAQVGQLETARFFHRLLPHGEELLFVAGAYRGGHRGDTEIIELASLAAVQDAAQPLRVGAQWRWPAYRGAAGESRAPSASLPMTWSVEEGVAWSTDLPGYGQSAPVAWDGQVFVTSVEGEEKETLILSAFDTESGDIRWRRRFTGSQRIPNTEMYSRAAPTPVVDADRLYAFWETGDLIAFDHDGETLWRYSVTEEHGDFLGNHGVASSPILVADLVVLQVTHEGPSYFLALDRATGEVRWKTEREEGVAWTTPLVRAGALGDEILSSAAGRVEALDGASGKVLWSIDGIEKNHVPSPILADDLLLVASSEPSQNQALKLSGSGQAELVWKAEGVTSGFGSPVQVGDVVLITNRQGVVTALELASGQERWRHRLPEGVWATPVVAGENVFFFTKNGETVVLKPGASAAEVVAMNSLPTKETIYGVAAIHDAFLVRSGTRLVRIGVEAASEMPGDATENLARLDVGSGDAGSED